MEKIKYVNKSSREIPPELMALSDSEITYEKINEVLDEYNLRVKEYERVFDSNQKTVEQIFVIGDISNG